MTDKEKINSVFRKIMFHKVIFLLFEGLTIYGIFKSDLNLALASLSIVVVLLATLVINLWEELNQERLNNYDR